MSRTPSLFPKSSSQLAPRSRSAPPLPTSILPLSLCGSSTATWEQQSQPLGYRASSPAAKVSLAKREELVSELTSFYEFPVILYLPPESLKRPEPGGWPSINQEQLDFLSKDQDVIEVLRHIPYIPRKSPLASYHIHESTVCNDFTGSYIERLSKGEKNVLRTSPSEEKIESCVATLARPESTFGYWIFYHEARHTLQLVHYHDWEMFEKGIKEVFEI